MKNERCIACGKTDFVPVLEYTEPDQYERAAGVSRADYYRAWVKCNGCGFHYSIYSRDDDAIDRLYESGYRDKSAPWRNGSSIEETFAKVTKLPADKSETKKRVRWIKDTIASLIRDRLVDPPSPPLSFLDVGGGNGIFAFEFRDADWHAHIADPSPEGRFVEPFGIHYTQDYFAPGVLTQQFDLISSSFMLEHVKDPVDLLRAMRGNLADTGFLFVEVPDESHFQLVGKEDDIFNSCHLWMFDPRSLTQMLFDAGFQTYAVAKNRFSKGVGLRVLAGPIRSTAASALAA